jgi:UDP-glucose 4-epimerase
MIDWSSKRVLVTGGTGSFGNFIVRRLLTLGAQEVRIMSRDEKKQYDMRIFYGTRPDLTFAIGDIRDRSSVDEAMEGINIAIQAAALKQVPTCERFPLEAIRTNTLGVANVVASALAHRVERLVCVSTDKAVKPVNVMGMTKALQERLVLQANLSRTNHGTLLACVRYGNVLRSRGSAIPFFRGLISQHKPIVITDERMTRFLLTLEDAIDLVMFAADSMTGGEVLVRKAPAARVMDLARVLCQQAGVPFEYEVIGAYPGEKLSEVLLSEEEVERTEDCGDYYQVLPWWREQRPRCLNAEYCSSDELVDLSSLHELIERADLEFERLEMPMGEYARF